MAQALPAQHPAVVLRSHYVRVRRLLAIAMAGVVALGAAVVILATDDDPRLRGSSANRLDTSTPQERRWTEYQQAIRSLTPEQLPAGVGAAGVSASQPRLIEDRAFPGLARQATPALTGHRHPRITQARAFPGLARQAGGATAEQRRREGAPGH